MITAGDERDLLTALHGGGEEDPLWSTFLVRLRRRFRADAARLVLLAQAGDPVQILSEPESSRPRRLAAGGDRLVEAIVAARLRSQRVYTLRELAEAASPDDPGNRLPEGLALRLAEGPFNAWLILTRQAPFAAAEGALVAALVPHLGIALANHARRESGRTRERLLGAVLDRLHLGWMTLARDGRILDADRRASALLRQGGLVGTGPAGELITASATANRRIAQALDQLRRGEEIASSAFRLCDAPRLDLLLKPLADPAASGAALVAYLQEDDSGAGEAAAETAALAALYDLAPREARLGLALAQGDGIPEAAARLGLSVETARNYSKSLYAKLGARGQAQLARIVARSLAGLA